jgi:hypothetical protein
MMIDFDESDATSTRQLTSDVVDCVAHVASYCAGWQVRALARDWTNVHRPICTQS